MSPKVKGLKGKKVLVTGSCGFIGSHLVERLIEEDCKVRAFAHYNSFNYWGWLESFPKEKLEKIEIFTGDIRDPYGVRKAMGDINIVFHLAALIGIPYSYYSPETYVDTNVKGTLNVMQAARDMGIEKAVHTSTSEVYGTAQYVPMNEDHPINPQSPYAATKAGADYLAQSFYRSFNLPVVVLRPFNTYGPRQSARAVIPTIITQILSGKKVISLGSVNTTRDLTYVKDIVEGLILGIDRSPEETIGKVVNLGSNFEISVKDLTNLIAKLIGITVEMQSEDVRKRPDKSEVQRLWADNRKAKEFLNWSPKYSLEEGLKETISWFEKNIQLYKPEHYNV